MAVNKSEKTNMTRLLVVRSLHLRIQQISVVFAALTVGAAIITAMASVYFDINTKMSQELRTFGANFFIGPQKGNEMPMSEFDNIIKQTLHKDLVAYSPYLYGVARTDLEKIILMGVNFGQLKQLNPYWQIKGKWVGVSFDQRNAMIGKKLAKRLEVNIGDTVELVKNNLHHKLKIKGIVETGEDTDSYLIVNIPLVQTWLDKANTINYGMMSINNAHNQVSHLASVFKQQAPDLEFRPILKVSASEGKVLDKIKGLMGVVAIIILILSTLCVNTTLTAMISERRREFALQKALGASTQAIVKQIICEALCITSVAITCGLVIGYILAQILGKAVFDSSIDLRLQVIPITVLLSTAAALIAVIIPIRQAINYQPAKVLKGE